MCATEDSTKVGAEHFKSTTEQDHGRGQHQEVGKRSTTKAEAEFLMLNF
jgi:hypothetical protein